MKLNTYTEIEVRDMLCEACKAGLNSISHSTTGAGMSQVVWEHVINGHSIYCTASPWRYCCASGKNIEKK